MATPRPVRSMDPYAQVFWEYTQHKEFRLQQCRECHKFRWPPGPLCDNCLSDQYDWALMTGRGKVLSWTTFHRAYFPEYPAPHTSMVLELDKGPLVVSYPVGIDAAQLHEGMVLTLHWTDGGLPVRRASDVFAGASEERASMRKSLNSLPANTHTQSLRGWLER